MSQISKLVGNRIKSIRKEKGWSQEELAFRAGIHPAYLGTVERGEKSVTLDSLEKIINALGVTFEDFFRYTSFKGEYVTTPEMYSIINRLNKRSAEDQKAILVLIDDLLKWKDS